MEIRQGYQLSEQTDVKRHRNIPIPYENITNTATNGIIETSQDIVLFITCVNIINKLYYPSTNGNVYVHSKMLIMSK